MKRLIWLPLILLLAPAGCGDDDPVAPREDFAVLVRVTDLDGLPVAGLALSLVSANPYLPGQAPAKARTTVPFRMARAAHATLRVEDVEGGHVRTLVDDDLNAGDYAVYWDAKDDAGIHQPSGRFSIIMVSVHPEDGLDFADTTDVLLNTEYVPVAVTDAEGRVVLTDRRLFPFLHDREPMVAMSEWQEPLGWLEPTGDMIFYLGDGEHSLRIYERTVTDGKQTLDLVWNLPQPEAAPSAAVVAAGRPAAAVPPPEQLYGLGPAYPNPFN
jgi:hypothetical protein